MFVNSDLVYLYVSLSLTADSLTLFLIWTIIYKSPKEMREYKYALLKLAICELLFNFTLGTIVLPDILLPVPCFPLLGLVRYFGETGATFAALLPFCTGCTVLTAVNDCCFTRSMIFSGKSSLLRMVFSWKGVVVVVLINLAICLSFAPSMYYSMRTVEEMLPYLEKEGGLSQINYYLDGQAAIVCGDFTSTSFLITCAVMLPGLVLIHIINISSSIAILKTIRENRRSMSPASFKAQQQMTIMLVLQSLYPAAMITVPVTVSLAAYAFERPEVFGYDVLKHFALVALFGYPVVGFCFAFYFVQPYRKFLCNKLARLPVLGTRFVKPDVVVEFTSNSSFKI